MKTQFYKKLHLRILLQRLLNKFLILIEELLDICDNYILDVCFSKNSFFDVIYLSLTFNSKLFEMTYQC